MKTILTLSILLFFTLNSTAQIKELPKLVVNPTNTRVVLKAFVDKNCNNKQDNDEPFSNNFTTTQWLKNSSKSAHQNSEIVYEGLKKGAQNFTAICNYTLNNESYNFEKKINILLTENSNIERIVAINAHCNVNTIQISTNNNAIYNSVISTKNTMPIVSNCNFNENFGSLNSWSTVGNSNFFIHEDGLSAKIPGAYNDVRLYKALPNKLDQLFSVSFDMFVQDYSQAGVAFLPLVFTEGDAPPSNPNQKPNEQTNQNAFGVLLSSDHYFTPGSEMYITPCQKTENKTNLDFKKDNRINISKNKWYRINLEKIDAQLATLQAWDAANQSWSKKITIKLTAPTNNLSVMQIANMVQADKNRNVTALVNNICIKGIKTEVSTTTTPATATTVTTKLDGKWLLAERLPLCDYGSSNKQKGWVAVPSSEKTILEFNNGKISNAYYINNVLTSNSILPFETLNNNQYIITTSETSKIAQEFEIIGNELILYYSRDEHRVAVKFKKATN